MLILFNIRIIVNYFFLSTSVDQQLFDEAMMPEYDANLLENGEN